MKLSKIFYLFFLAFLVSCSKDDHKISFTFLQVNDVYEIAPIQGGKYGGIARLETVHQELLNENANTMLVMAGDFLNPSLLGTMKHEGERIRGRQMIEVMNAMDFEVAAFGNHEFDLQPNDLQKRLNESNFPWISANVFYKKGDSLTPFYQKKNGIKKEIKGSYIKEISDADGTKIKIGIISVCIPSNPKDFVKYTDMYSEIEEEYNAIKNKVDLVFGLTHVKIEEDRKIAALLPNIPLIMGGHEHTFKDEKVGEVHINKADANAKTTYIHRIEFDTKTKEISIKSELKEITDEIKEEATVNTIVNKWQTILNNQISQVVDDPYEVIYHTKIPLEARDTPIRSVQTNMGNIIAKSMMEAYKNEVDCAIVNGGSIRIDDVLTGDISSIDIFRVLPYGGGVFKVKMDGSLLLQVLEYGEKASGSGPYLQRAGITYENGQWLVNQKKIQTNKTYSVATSDYLMRGLDIPFLDDKNPKVLSVTFPTSNKKASDIRKAVIEYLKAQK